MGGVRELRADEGNDMQLTLLEAQGLPVEELARRLDTAAAEWQSRMDSGLMTPDDWEQHEVFVACRLLAGLGDLFPP